MISITSRGGVVPATLLASNRSSLMQVDHRPLAQGVDRHNELGHGRKQPLTALAVANHHNVVGSVPEDAADDPENAPFAIFDPTAKQIIHVEFACAQRRKRRLGQAQLPPSQQRRLLAGRDTIQSEQEPVGRASHRRDRCRNVGRWASNHHRQRQWHGIQTPASRVKRAQTNLARGAVRPPQDSKGQDLGMYWAQRKTPALFEDLQDRAPFYLG